MGGELNSTTPYQGEPKKSLMNTILLQVTPEVGLKLVDYGVLFPNV